MNIDEEIARCSGPVDRDGGSVLGRDFLFPLDFIGFKGHFPGMPVLPAIVQLRMLALLLRDAGTEGCAPSGEEDAPDIISAKFTSPAGPGVPLRLVIERSGTHWKGGITAMESGTARTVAEFKFKAVSHDEGIPA